MAFTAALMQEAHDSEEFCPEAQVNYYPAEKLEFRDVPACRLPRLGLGDYGEWSQVHSFE